MDKNMIPEISIAIPTYEMKGFGNQYLLQLFETIRDQNFKNFEVCISDHSKDDSILEVCEEYANYFEIKYFKNEENRGNSPANVNSSVEMCNGKITKIIFQDDLFIDKSALSKIKSAFDDHYCSWCVSGFVHTINGTQHFRPMIPKWTDMILEGRNLLGSPSCVSFLTEKFEKFDENLKLLMDTDFYHRMRYNNGMPFIIQDYLISNREHSNRISSSHIKYDKVINHPEGSWMVNEDELNYVLEKNKNIRNYSDEN
jgi:glycosyltransferase involved in cell wall biosynthesis